LKAVLLKDADDTTGADRESGLAELLCDDLNRGVRIEEAVPDDLPNDLVGADIVGFGAGLVRHESIFTTLTIEFEQLKISLSAEAELRGGIDDANPFALAFEEHGEAGNDEIIRTNGKLSGWADDTVIWHVEVHGVVLREKAEGREAGWHHVRIAYLGRLVY
jgi:hypothetical protein